ncbi:MAG: hypothetical protein PCFJNLEI_02398 [Verrucomicrobiae bacterium]|nr:hypothetical protein [Verrucomicrobiae bacterium]
MPKPSNTSKLASDHGPRLDRASQAQLFGPLSIYHIQQKSERLARDLSFAFFPLESDSLKIALALRDGYTEEHIPALSGVCPTRFYRPGFIYRYHFLTQDNRTHFENRTDTPESSDVFGWIQWFSQDVSVIGLERGTKDEWKALVSHVEREKADRWSAWDQRGQSKEQAFEHIASVFSHLRYSGLTPGKLDALSSVSSAGDNGGPQYPLFFITGSTRGDETKKASITGKAADLHGSAWATQFSETEIDEISFAEGPESGKQSGSRNLYLRFLDPFFLGADKPSDASFHGLALPLYDRWEAGGPMGAFVGWVFIYSEKNTNLHKQLFETLLSKTPLGHSWREVLRANFNDYAESLAEHVIDEEITAYNPAKVLDPSGYFRWRFKFIEGWTVEDAKCEGLTQGEFFAHTIGEDGFGRLCVRLDDDSARYVLLKQKFDTKIPKTDGDTYYERIATWARSFWQDLNHIYNQYKAGQLEGRMRVSHSIPYTISIHLNKLRSVSDAIEQLRQSSAPFPIISFGDIPPEIRSFRYPVELYSLAVENALLHPPDSDSFRRLMPVIDWIDEAITESGLTESLVRRIADSIARPLAKISLQRADVVRDPSAPLNVIGVLPVLTLGFESHFEGRVFIAVVIEFLREAFHHCSGPSPLVEVTLSSQDVPSLCVTNTCVEEADPARLGGGNQSAMLDRFASHLPTWQIVHPKSANGRWTREIRKRV